MRDTRALDCEDYYHRDYRVQETPILGGKSMVDNHTEAYISWKSEFLLLPKGSVARFLIYIASPLLGKLFSHAQVGIVFCPGSIIFRIVEGKFVSGFCYH